MKECDNSTSYYYYYYYYYHHHHHHHHRRRRRNLKVRENGDMKAVSPAVNMELISKCMMKFSLLCCTLRKFAHI
jgi:hypothetical protein